MAAEEALEEFVLLTRTKASDPQKVSKPSHWGEAQGMAKLSSDVCVDADSVCRKADKIKN